MKRKLLTGILVLLPWVIFGQLTPVTNHYMLNHLTINPAYAGSRGALNIAASYRRQWLGIEGAPQTTALSFDAPFFDDKIGLGIQLVNDMIGVTKETQLITNYAYRIDVENGKLALGLGAGLTATNVAWSDLVVLDPGDELYLTDSRLFVIPNFSFGVFYSYKKHYAGLSVPRLLSSDFNFDKNKYTIHADLNNYNLLLTYGYSHKLSEKIELVPSVLFSYMPKGKLLADINMYVSYADKLWAGGSMRTGRSFAALFQCRLNNQIKLAYSYDFEFGKLSRYSNGSHEVMLRYEFRYKIDVVNPLIF